MLKFSGKDVLLTEEGAIIPKNGYFSSSDFLSYLLVKWQDNNINIKFADMRSARMKNNGFITDLYDVITIMITNRSDVLSDFYTDYTKVTYYLAEQNNVTYLVCQAPTNWKRVELNGGSNLFEQSRTKFLGMSNITEIAGEIND